MVNVEKFVISEVAPQQTNVAWFNPVDKKLRFYTNGWQELADENTQIQSDWNQSDNTKVDFIKNKPIIGHSTLQITGTFDTQEHEFTCTSGHSIANVKDALLAGTPVIVDVVVDPDVDNIRYVTSDISVNYDSGTWYAQSNTFTQGVIDSWVVSNI